MRVTVGVIGVQGDVSEHIELSKRALDECDYEGEIAWVRTAKQLEDVDALIVPGGESTTISKFIVKTGMFQRIVDRARKGMPLMGTCAGCVLLAKEGDDEVRRTGTRLLGLMDMAVKRNAFGRQRESFEVNLEVQGLGSYPAVFIRAPEITKVWGECKPLATFDNRIVMAVQANIIALAFHPELSCDTRIHKMLLEKIREGLSEQ